jgi:hypothetical protein
MGDVISEPYSPCDYLFGFGRATAMPGIADLLLIWKPLVLSPRTATAWLFRTWFGKVETRGRSVTFR